MILRIQYNDLHLVSFHMEDALGPLTECKEAYTNFKTGKHYYNRVKGMMESLAVKRGICYTLVDT